MKPKHAPPGCQRLKAKKFPRISAFTRWFSVRPPAGRTESVAMALSHGNRGRALTDVLHHVRAEASVPQAIARGLSSVERTRRYFRQHAKPHRAPAVRQPAITAKHAFVAARRFGSMSSVSCPRNSNAIFRDDYRTQIVKKEGGLSPFVLYCAPIPPPLKSIIQRRCSGNILFAQ